MRQPSLGSRVDWSNPINEGLIRWWLFNEGSGDRIYDISLNGNHRDLTNMNPATDWILTDRPSISGHAVDFDGVDAHSDLGVESYLEGVTKLSITLWAKLLDESRGTTWLYNKLDGGNSFQAFYDGNDIRSRLDAGGSNTVINGPDKASFDYDDWWFYCATYDGANHSIYFNGQLEASASLTGTTDLTGSSTNLFLGHHSGLAANIGWLGPITNVRLHTCSLTANQIMELYENPFAGILRRRQKYFVSAVVASLISQRHNQLQGVYRL